MLTTGKAIATFADSCHINFSNNLLKATVFKLQLVGNCIVNWSLSLSRVPLFFALPGNSASEYRYTCVGSHNGTSSVHVFQVMQKLGLSKQLDNKTVVGCQAVLKGQAFAAQPFQVSLICCTLYTKTYIKPCYMESVQLTSLLYHTWLCIRSM